MSRVQLALNVGNLDEAVAFYTKLFQTPPAKIRAGYANFAIAEPPLKLVLIAGAGEPGTMNHVGVEVETTEMVADAIGRFEAEGMATDIQEATTCCYAVQDKVWVQGPDIAWEVYTVLADADSMVCLPTGCSTDTTSTAAVEATAVAETPDPALVGAKSPGVCC